MIRWRGLLLAWLLAGNALADEGMWLFNQPPRERLLETHQFRLEQSWLDNVMRSCVRFNNGGSGAFVSGDGLVMTNHHIGTDSLQKLSRPGRDLVQEGFLAKNLSEELPCPDLELNVLLSIEDVTRTVESAVSVGMDDARAASARAACISEIEKLERQKTGLRCDVVTLYLGGAYHLYRYKKYTDVRLVMAPEQAAAFFGGDVDNFEFPRHDFDCCFFRVYEEGRPLRGNPYLKWSQSGPKEGDLVFVAGHPGRTNRLETLARLEHLRDHTLPLRLAWLRGQELALRLYSQQSPEAQRQAQAALYSLANGRKAFTGQYGGLLDRQLMATKKAGEERQRAWVAKNPAWKEKAGTAWETIARGQQKLTAFEQEYWLLEQRLAFHSNLFSLARHLARWAQEKEKPSSQRLREYRDSNLDSLWLEVLSPAPNYPDLEVAQLISSLSFAAERLGGQHPLVETILQGKSPEVRANELVAKTSVSDPERRKAYRQMSLEQLRQQGDPMVDLALAVDEASRKVRRSHEVEVVEPELKAYAQIARSQLAMSGGGVAPDATFTLRLAYGVVKGYSEPRRQVAFTTTLGGAFAQAELQKHQEPFRLPQSWQERRQQLNLEIPYNFVTTADTIGGNSGSPVLNREAEVVGLNFDRNRHGLTRNFVYSEERARHISVHSQAILHLLEKVYDCPWLVQELREGKRPGS